MNGLEDTRVLMAKLAKDREIQKMKLKRKHVALFIAAHWASQYTTVIYLPGKKRTINTLVADDLIYLEDCGDKVKIKPDYGRWFYAMMDWHNLWSMQNDKVRKIMNEKKRPRS